MLMYSREVRGLLVETGLTVVLSLGRHSIRREAPYASIFGVLLTVRHSETQSPTLMRPTTPGGEIRCPQKNETGYFECPRLHNSAETIPEP